MWSRTRERQHVSALPNNQDGLGSTPSSAGHRSFETGNCPENAEVNVLADLFNSVYNKNTSQTSKKCRRLYLHNLSLSHISEDEVKESIQSLKLESAYLRILIKHIQILYVNL